MGIYFSISTSKALTLFVAGLVASVFLAELGLRAIEFSPLWKVLPVVERELGLPDTKLGYKFKPNYELINVRENRARVATNSLAMRDAQRNQDSTPNTFHIAVMGDSYTEALQVPLEDTFTFRSEQILALTSGNRRVQVLNFGMSGAGPLQQLIRHELDASAFEPDVSVFVIGVNDFLNQELSNDSSGPAYVGNSAQELQIGRQYQTLLTHRIQHEWYGRLFFWLMDHSRIARAAFLKYRVGDASFQAPNQERNVPSCSSSTAMLKKHQNLWIDEQPPHRFWRLQKYLNDVSEAKIPRVSFALYDLHHPPQACPEAVVMRVALIAGIRQRLAAHDISLIDLDAALFSANPEKYSTRGFHGFGARVGVGHLNQHGHKIYAVTLAGEIDKLIRGRSSQ
ncbi:MAG: SGNH/GDSL hydrolase family protein [Gammaproteobacteria bacterium]